LRNYYSVDQQPWTPEKTRLKYKDPHVLFPVMMTLFALEYINAQEESDLRMLMKACLSGTGKATDKIKEKITPHIIHITSQRLLVNNVDMYLVDAVEPFVLPAMEEILSSTEDKNAEETS